MVLYITLLAYNIGLSTSLGMEQHHGVSSGGLWIFPD